MVALLPVTPAGPAPTPPCGDLEGVPPGSSSEGGHCLQLGLTIQAAKPSLSEGAVEPPLRRGRGRILTLRPQSPRAWAAGSQLGREAFCHRKALKPSSKRKPHNSPRHPALVPGAHSRRWIHGRPPFRGWPAAPQPSSLPGSELLGDTGLSSSPIK